VRATAAGLPQRRFLESKGEGVFHLGFEFPVIQASAAGARLGLDILMTGERDNGTGFVYFDTEERVGKVRTGARQWPDRPDPLGAVRR